MAYDTAQTDVYAKFTTAYINAFSASPMSDEEELEEAMGLVGDALREVFHAHMSTWDPDNTTVKNTVSALLDDLSDVVSDISDSFPKAHIKLKKTWGSPPAPDVVLGNLKETDFSPQQGEASKTSTHVRGESHGEQPITVSQRA